MMSFHASEPVGKRLGGAPAATRWSGWCRAMCWHTSRRTVPCAQIVLVMETVSSWAFFASSSAFLLPLTPVLEGTHWMTMWHPRCWRSHSFPTRVATAVQRLSGCLSAMRAEHESAMTAARVMCGLSISRSAARSRAATVMVVDDARQGRRHCLCMAISGAMHAVAACWPLFLTKPSVNISRQSLRSSSIAACASFRRSWRGVLLLERLPRSLMASGATL